VTETETETAEAEVSTEGPAAGNRAGAGWAALAVAVAAGLALRAFVYARGRSVWVDEAWLVNNILGRDWAALFRPLDDHQGAPFGFLAAEKLATTLFGPGEWALRLVPMLGSIATLLLVARIGRRLGGGTAAIAAALAAFAPGLIYYGIEIKQYSTDAAFTLLILDRALALWDRGVTPGRAAGFGLVGLVALWFSHPSVFALAASGTALMVGLASRGRWAEARLVAASAAAWLAGFAVEYVVQLRHLARDPYLKEFWAEGYLKFPPRSFREASRYVHVGLGVFRVPFEDYSESTIGHAMAPLAAMLWALGVVMLASARRWVELAILAGPLAVAAVASLLGGYPLTGRMILFLSGPSLLTMAAGIAPLLVPGPAALRRVGAVLLIGVLWLPIEHDARVALQSPRTPAARAVLGKVAREWQDGDVLVLHWATRPPFDYYKRSGTIPGLDRVEPGGVMIGEKNSPTVARAGAPLKGKPRVWFVVERHPLVASVVIPEMIFHDLDASSRRLEEEHVENCWGVLYDCR
jgi:hypothetical protein